MTAPEFPIPSGSYLVTNGEENVAAGGAASQEALVQALETSKLSFDAATSTGQADKTSSGPGFTIIVDPIDGTANFASGLPLCAVTMSIVYQDIPIIGIVYDPHREEFFSAIRGQGTWLKERNGNQIRLQVQSAISLLGKDSVLRSRNLLLICRN